MMMKLMKYLICLLLLLSGMNVWAVKADPTPVNVKQPDGTWLTVVLHGDEYFHYYTTTDDVLIVQQQQAFFVAAVDDNGDLHPTSILAHNAGMRQAEELKAIAAQPTALFEQAATQRTRTERARREPIERKGNMFPHEGSPRAVVILVEFSDTTFTIENPKRSFDEYFNAEGELSDFGFGEAANISSASEYFRNVSFGQFTPQFDVYGPVRVPGPLKEYGGTAAGGTGEDMGKLFREACALIDDSLDFSQYDANDDGQVDLVIAIYAGYSESMSGNSAECIWPKSGTVAGGTYDGKEVQRYLVSAELNGFPGCWSREPLKRINGTGTLCHEFCHTMGLPDFYPTAKSVKNDNQGMEYWSLMDSGNYLINGYSPVALTAWEREAFGWITISTLTSSQDLQLTALDDGGCAYRILNDNDDTQHEYFIIENIQNIGHNSAQKGHGLLVYHVDYDSELFSLKQNSVNNVVGKPRMTVVPADGLLFAQYNVGKTINGTKITNSFFYNQLAGDPFPGTTNATALNDTTDHVNFQVYKGEKLNKALLSINENEDGVVSLKYVDNFEEVLSGINDVRMDGRCSDGHIYTLQGISVADGGNAGDETHRLPKGIYIERGKKIIVK